jgi:uncharacterized protein
VSAADLFAVAAVVLFAATVQVVAGFAFSLLAVPLMAIVIPTRQAVVVATLLSLMLSARLAWQLRADADRIAVRDLACAAYVGMPVGLAIFVAVSDRTLQVMLGVATVAAVIFLASRVDISHVGRRLEYAAGFLAGVLNTSLSTSGPPVVFALQSRRLGAREFRATVSAVFAVIGVGGLIGFVATGKVDAASLRAAAVGIPALLLGHVLGAPLRARVDEQRFRHLVLALLVLAAGSTLVAAW